LTQTEAAQQCALCGHDDAAEVERGISRDIAITNVICKRCTLVYMRPYASPVDSAGLYKSGSYWGEASDSAVQVSDLRSAHIAEFCAPYLSAGATVLDIGCASGETLARMRDRFDCKPVGIEPDQSLSEHARQTHGIEVLNTTVEELDPGQIQADMIVMSHVLEHFNAPRDALQKVRTWLKPNGLMYVEVPNLFVHQSFELAHPFTFHRGTLVEMLRAEGFNVQWFKSHGKGRPLRLPYFLSVIVGLADKPTEEPQVSAGYQTVLARRKIERKFSKTSEFAMGLGVKMLKLMMPGGFYRGVKGFYWRILDGKN
jgi:2-polyprenyl-3-methyl-5-hydroxy-6-metoxy-1,4-benzoquinol methylase